jgi:hypothetical protein
MPSVRTLGVDLESVCVRIPHHIEPVLCPAFRIPRRSEQLLDDPRIRLGFPMVPGEPRGEFRSRG